MKKMLMISIIIITFLFINNIIIALTSNEIIKLNDAGFSEKTIQLLIVNDDISMTIDDIIKMKKIGIEEETIRRMIKKEQDKKSPPKEKPIPKPVYKEQPIKSQKRTSEKMSGVYAGYCYPPNWHNISKGAEDFFIENGWEWDIDDAKGFYLSYIYFNSEGISWKITGIWGSYNSTLTWYDLEDHYGKYKYSFGQYSVSVLFLKMKENTTIYYGPGIDYIPWSHSLVESSIGFSYSLSSVPILGGHVLLGGDILLGSIELNVELKYIVTIEVVDEEIDKTFNASGIQLLAGIGFRI